MSGQALFTTGHNTFNSMFDCLCILELQGIDQPWLEYDEYVEMAIASDWQTALKTFTPKRFSINNAGDD